MAQLQHRYRGVLEGLRLAERADVLNLYAARAARGFGDGFAAIILPAYLLEIGFDPFQIGLVAAAALLGSAVTTLAVGFLAPRYPLRTLLLACAALMVLTGVAIPGLQHLVVIALVAFIGTMNPTTGDIGVHVPLEQAALAHALAVRAFRSLARRRERVLLLVERAHRPLLSGRGAAGQALRPRQHHGVHPYPLERLSHSRSLLAEPHHRARAAAGALRALADGRADAHVLRHGGGGPRPAGGRPRG